ncbi:hypothetical protein ABB37_03204 [Leptomonas pyrrhocoris]|uniref:Uncharacterized protein n=1 Tax=Leptomonas pyrrhocoris TaxID=157538 RepID=A0A0N0DWQ0_LEPPY|nr:hypothetical protein ABB37_03204 [Leptomonas pyrrhocoris]KPA82032.1 hypothetical protein ABB37_03204 [Leptomonas pyrrhocoris]|eukprot:XP_015660471.1 hypothetical protein ABB37_03204 [Leptomonas pyrrhocoris]
MAAPPSDDLARLREELAREEAELAELESDVEAKAAQLGYLHTEYTLNKMRLCHYYEPRLQPLRSTTCAAAEKESLLQLQIEWLERFVVEQERRSQGGVFIEVRDMKPAAEEYEKKARQTLLRCYEHILECPEDALRMISQYACPPDDAIATMQLVMKVRGEPLEECTWGAAQVLLSYNYFHDFFVTRSESLLKRCDLLDDNLMNELELFCANPHHAVAALYQVSIPIGCMGEWLRAIRDYYRVKLVTAPVLLPRSANTRHETERARSWLKAVTLGGGEAAESSAKRPSTLFVEKGNSAAAESAAADNTAATEMDTEEKAALESYEAVKENLQQFTQSAAEATELVVKLRHRLHRLRESVRVAEEERAAIEKEMEEKLEEVRGNYDGTMVPLEDQLEGTTETFVQRITRKSANTPLPPPTPADTAAVKSSEQVADAVPA